MAKTKPSLSKARILIVEDHPLMVRGLADLINSQPDLEVCGEAGESSEALAKVLEVNPDLVVIDIALKDSNGIELIKQIKEQVPGVRMLVSSMHDESLYAERAVRAGAMGFISKAQAAEHVIDAIRQVLRGKIYLSGGVTEQVLRRAVGGRPLERSPIDGLSDRELEVFEMIGNGLTTRQIAEKLELSIKTIETHRDNIKTKLGLRNSTEMTRHAVQWVLERQ